MGNSLGSSGGEEKETRIPKFSKLQVELIQKLWAAARAMGSAEPGRSILIEVLTQAPEIETIFHFAKHSVEQHTASSQQAANTAAVRKKTSRITGAPPDLSKLSESTEVFEQLEQRRNSASSAGEPLDFRIHARRFTNVLEAVVTDINCLDADVHDLLFELGKQHADHRESGFSPKHWDIFAEAMIAKTLEWQTEGENETRNRAQHAAWSILILYIVNRMKDGHRSGLNIKREQSMNYLASVK